MALRMEVGNPEQGRASVENPDAGATGRNSILPPRNSRDKALSTVPHFLWSAPVVGGASKA